MHLFFTLELEDEELDQLHRFESVDPLNQNCFMKLQVNENYVAEKPRNCAQSFDNFTEHEVRQ